MGPKAKKASYVRSTIKQNLWREESNEFDEHQDGNEGLTRLDEAYITESDMQAMHQKTEYYASKFSEERNDAISYYIRVLKYGRKNPSHISHNLNDKEIKQFYVMTHGKVLLSTIPDECTSFQPLLRKRKRVIAKNDMNDIVLSSKDNVTNKKNGNIDKAKAELDAKLEKAMELENSHEMMEFEDDSVTGAVGEEEEEDEGDYQENYYYHDSDDDHLEEEAEATF